MTTTLPVVLGVVIPIVSLAIVLVLLHRRHVKKLRREDANDEHKDLDFGMEAVVPGIGGSGGNGNVEMAMAGSEKIGHGHVKGMSMDLGHNPYLLPPGLQNSHESLLSLSRSMNGDNDKYRPAINVATGDSASLRSFRSNPKWGQDDTSSYTGSTKLGQADDGQQGLLRNAQRMSRSSPSPEGIPNPNGNAHAPKKPVIVKNTIQTPPPAKLSPKSSNHDKDSSHLSVEVSDLRKSNNYLGAFIHSGNASPDPDDQPKYDTAIKAPIRESHEQTMSNNEDAHTDSDYSEVSAPALNLDLAKSSAQVPRISLPFTDEASDYGDDQDRDIGIPVVHISPDDKETRLTGGPSTPADFLRQSLYNNDNGIDTRRLTMGIRPLPPEDPSDNPEQRANRIRSFYKEYFDDSRPNHEGDHHYGPEYYTDGVVYDPITGDYSGGPSKPFAQPVGRRAMTPPPRAPPRFQGGPGHMATNSAAGFMHPGPRAFSSVSGHLPGRGPRKPAPPPSPLHVLPSPHLLKDDMSVLPIDYAPGKTYKERKEGRPETPKGGLRPYTPMRAHTPLVSSFDDLAVIPSPHALRKSGIFTSLDFAPPPRFKNGDSASDSGSIRSNRTGISAAHARNIRAGAYRVSRLPVDTVGTKNDITSNLRPQWDMR
jgi:hypothetical protein